VFSTQKFVDFSSALLVTIDLGEEGAVTKKQTPEQWFLDQLAAYAHRQPSAERTPQCRDDSFLQAYAANPDRFALSDPDVAHVSSCNHCMPRLLQFRATRSAASSLRSKLAGAAALSAALLLVGFLIGTSWRHQRQAIQQAPQSAELNPPASLTERTLDLTEYGTYRGAGEQPEKPPLILPRALLHINLILPRFSEAGMYSILVAADRGGKNRLACTSGQAVLTNGRTAVAFFMDLRSIKPGDYLLLTELNGQDDFYSYPLRIQ
jgi:hypothetical protein